MRTIKFRGKRIDNGKFTYGDLLHCKGKDAGLIFIKTDTGLHEVDPVTVGQFTGLKDNNGKEIYEGDIIKRTANMRNYAECNGEKVSVFDVKYYGCELLPFSEWGSDMEEYDVIGNIHDNIELLDEYEC